MSTAARVVAHAKLNLLLHVLDRRSDGYHDIATWLVRLALGDDVVVRVRPDPEGARVDIRSTSRYGRHDFGTNAARIVSLSAAIDDAVDDATPDKPAEPLKKGKKTDPKAAKTAPADKRR